MRRFLQGTQFESDVTSIFTVQLATEITHCRLLRLSRLSKQEHQVSTEAFLEALEPFKGVMGASGILACKVVFPKYYLVLSRLHLSVLLST